MLAQLTRRAGEDCAMTQVIEGHFPARQILIGHWNPPLFEGGAARARWPGAFAVVADEVRALASVPAIHFPEYPNLISIWNASAAGLVTNSNLIRFWRCRYKQRLSDRTG